MAQSLLTKSYLTTGKGASALVLALAMFGPLVGDAYAQRTIRDVMRSVGSQAKAAPQAQQQVQQRAPSTPAPRPAQSSIGSFRGNMPAPAPVAQMRQTPSVQQFQRPIMARQQPMPQQAATGLIGSRLSQARTNDRSGNHAQTPPQAFGGDRSGHGNRHDDGDRHGDRGAHHGGGRGENHGDRAGGHGSDRQVFSHAVTTHIPMERRPNYGYYQNYGHGYGNGYYAQSYGRDYGHSMWNRHHWRGDRRHDWQDYRRRHRSTFSLGFYYSPYQNFRYQRLDVGYVLGSLFFSANYWINDPWQYRLPEAYGPYRWVRYYDDAVLVDIYSGAVVDVVYDIFW